MDLGENQSDLLLKISVDNKDALKGVAQTGDAIRSLERTQASASRGIADSARLVAQQLRSQGVAAEDAARALKVLGVSGQEAAEAVAQAFGEVPEALKPAEDSVRSFGKTVRSQLGDLRALRQAMYASFGLVSFGYIISEWGRVADAVKTAALEVGGFGAAAQKAFQDDIKASDDALVHFQGLTTNLKIATGEFLLRQSQQRKLAAESERAEAQRNLDFINGLLGPAGAFLDLKDTYKRLLSSNEEATWRAREQKQLQDLAKLEKQLHQEQAAGARKSEAAAMKAARAEAEWKKQVYTLDLHMDRVTDRINERLSTHREKLHQAGLAGLPKAPAGPLGGAEGLQPLAAQIAAQTKLNEAERQALPTERQIAIVRRRLADLYPDLTKAEIQQASQAAAADGAIRKRIALYGEQAQITKQLIGYMREYYSVEQRSMTQGIQVGQTMKQIAGATIQSGIAAAIYGKSIGQAMKAATKAVLASVAEQSAVEAIFYMAKGIADSFWNPPAAAAEFHAAEMFGALAAGAGVAAAAIPSGGSAKAQGGSGSEYGGGAGSRAFSVGSGFSRQQLVPGGNLPPAPKNGNLTISIMGDQEAGQWLANTLNTAVQQGGAQLTATRTTAIPNPVA